LPSGRIARLGATADFHHGLLDARLFEVRPSTTSDVEVLREHLERLGPP
jgi:hypothetical protein